MDSGRHIAWFEDIGLGDREQVGGKGGSLGELKRAGIAVPPGFVVKDGRVRAVSRVARAAGTRARGASPRWTARTLRRSPPARQALRRRIESAQLPADLLGSCPPRHATLTRRCRPAGRGALLRHDRGCRGCQLRGPAGHLPVGHGAAADAGTVRSCWASLYSVESMIYRRRHGIPGERVAMAVVVQIMVDAGAAGVMFTRSPTDRRSLGHDDRGRLGSGFRGGRR